MPNLMDIAIISMNKTRVYTPYKALNSVIDNNKVTQEVSKQTELKLKNRLKTKIQVGSKTYTYEQPEDSKGEFASWSKELNRSPKTDTFQLQPINKVKNTDKEDIKQEMLSYKIQEWLDEVDARMAKLRHKP